MSFYVGQRVRIRASGPRHGREATLISFDLSLHEEYGFGCYWDALVDGWGCRDPRDGVAFAYQESDLEPIVPPGLESLDEINALYEPEPCTADVDSRGFHVPDIAKSRDSDRVGQGG